MLEKRSIILLFCVLLIGTITAQNNNTVYTFETIKNLYPILDSNNIVKHTPIPSFVEGINHPVLSLNGEWLFSSHVTELNGDKKSSLDWKMIPVPSEWYMESFKVEKGKWAAYYKEFVLPEDWENRKVLIRFGAVESECCIFLNKNYIGEHKGSMTQFEKELTNSLTIGKNELIVYVRSESLASEISKLSHYAKHQVGGLLRSVELITVPQTYIDELHCDVQLSDNLKQGLLGINLSLSQKMKNPIVELYLKERGIEGLKFSGKCLYKKKFKLSGLINIAIDSPQLWHAESPFLYTIEVSLFDGKRKTESIIKNIGFRKIEIKGNVLLVNNRPVKLRGVSRHDISSFDGRAVKDTAFLHRDIKQLRNANCNYIRTSHYPPDSYMLDLCDRYGIFVEDEAPVCWESGLDTYDKVNQIFYCFKSMVLRDKDHPCILLWSLGNESSWKPKFYNCLLFAKLTTPNIPVKFSHSETHGIIKATDIGTKHYPGWKGLMAFENYYRPIIFGEALHLNCYNTSENITDPGLRDSWGEYLKYFVDFIQESPSIVGLGIWGCVDEMFYPKGNTPCGYGPWGVVDGFRREKPEFWHMKMAYSPIVITSKHFQTSGNETLVNLENRYNILNADKVDLVWADGEQNGRTRIDLLPGTQGTLRLPHVMKGDTLTLVVRDRRGFDISVWKIPRAYSSYFSMPELSEGKVDVILSDSAYQIFSKDVEYEFSRQTGLLTFIKKNGELITEYPIQVYAVPHLKENEVIDYIPQERDNKQVCFSSEPMKEWIFLSDTIVYTENGVNITVRGKYADNPIEMTYSIDNCNRLRIDYILNIFKMGNGIRQIGIGLNLPKKYDMLSWNRKSLWSFYPDNHIGRSKGVAKAFYSETLDDYLTERCVPIHTFDKDGNIYGSNDFRSTKHQIITGKLIAKDGSTVTVESNGKQHFRAWILPECTSFMVANYSDSGNEFYLNYDASRTKYLDAYIAEDGDFAGWMQLNFN